MDGTRSAKNRLDIIEFGSAKNKLDIIEFASNICMLRNINEMCSKGSNIEITLYR